MLGIRDQRTWYVYSFLDSLCVDERRERELSLLPIMRTLTILYIWQEFVTDHWLLNDVYIYCFCQSRYICFIIMSWGGFIRFGCTFHKFAFWYMIKYPGRVHNILLIITLSYLLLLSINLDILNIVIYLLIYIMIAWFCNIYKTILGLTYNCK